MTNQCFSVRDIEETILADGYLITITTDIPCHLWLRWTTNQPWIHDIPVLRRGIYMHGDRYFCFTAYEDNEQAEPGDTTIHTFIKRAWLPCETRYFYFLGQINAQPSPSTTAIFSLHLPLPEPPPSLSLAFIDTYTISPIPDFILTFAEHWY